MNTSNNNNFLRVNTAPGRNVRKKDQSVFWTVLVTVSRTILSENGITEAPTKVTMSVREKDVPMYEEAFKAAKSAGLALIVRGDEVVVTTPRPNDWTDKDGVFHADTQSSAWATNPMLDVISDETGVSDALAALLAG